MLIIFCSNSRSTPTDITSSNTTTFSTEKKRKAKQCQHSNFKGRDGKLTKVAGRLEEAEPELHRRRGSETERGASREWDAVEKEAKRREMNQRNADGGKRTKGREMRGLREREREIRDGEEKRSETERGKFRERGWAGEMNERDWERWRGKGV